MSKSWSKSGRRKTPERIESQAKVRGTKQHAETLRLRGDGAMLVEDGRISESLRRIVHRFTSDQALQQDLLQECLLCLWRVESAKPGQTKSWYLQNCRFHVQHWLASGRSIDSVKRVSADNRIAIDETEIQSDLPDYHTDGELLAAVSARDMVSTLARHLDAREQLVLHGLSDGLPPSEISVRFRISRPTVLKYRRKIAALSVKLGINHGCGPERKRFVST